jgi:hypothetical protein
VSWLDVHLDARDAARADDEQLLLDAAEVLLWCSGSSDFAPGGIAHKGWLKVRPVLDRLIARTRTISCRCDCHAIGSLWPESHCEVCR